MWPEGATFAGFWLGFDLKLVAKHQIYSGGLRGGALIFGPKGPKMRAIVRFWAFWAKSSALSNKMILKGVLQFP